MNIDSANQSFTIPYLETNVIQSLQRNTLIFNSIPSNVYIATYSLYTYKVVGFIENNSTGLTNYFGCLINATKFNITPNSSCIYPSFTGK